MSFKSRDEAGEEKVVIETFRWEHERLYAIRRLCEIKLNTEDALGHMEKRSIAHVGWTKTSLQGVCYIFNSTMVKMLRFALLILCTFKNTVMC